MNILTGYTAEGEKYYNVFPVSIRSTLNGKEWTYRQHQTETHGTNHKFASEYEVIADLTSQQWVRAAIWNGNIFEHPKGIDENLLIKVNDDDVDSDNDTERLREVLRSEFQHYINAINDLPKELQERIVHAAGSDSW